jgi:N-acetylglucosaminyldiphosphoundecaprenol N-acetyl-beta-D-mannosaminyltransferase
MKISLCGVRIDSYSFDEVLEKIIIQAASESDSQYVVTPNAQHLVTLQHDLYFREIYKSAFLSVPDGVPLLWAAKFLKTPLKSRVNGTDLFEKTCEVASEKALKVFLLGGRPGAADAVAKMLSRRHPNLIISGTYCPPYEFEADAKELTKINELIKSASPHILFVGLGAPKQEKWIYENYKKLNVPISIGIGVSFELVSGMVRRAPKIMQSLGLEWFFRLLMEPKRLWKRYVVGNVVFVYLVIKQKLGFLKKSGSF